MVAPVHSPPNYAEFFCGGGMVRAALDADWTCVLANDIDPRKGAIYARNWGETGLIVGDVGALDASHLLQPIDLYWASSPCQDFSLAGKGAGLSGARSGVFTTWIDAIRPAVEQGFGPRLIAFENVTGLIARGGGRDLTEVLRQINALGYKTGALEIDARHFLPQSRPRLFVVAVRADVVPDSVITKTPGPFHSKRLQSFVKNAPKDIQDQWVWWDVAMPRLNVPQLIDLTEDQADTPWLSPDATQKLLDMMSAPSLERVAEARTAGEPRVGALYKRGRPDASGKVRQRAEVRFDGRAGCLRTPMGGSSRQTLLFVDGADVRARLLSKREAMRLMGLPDHYITPDNYNEAYKVAGDGVVVPVVRHLDRQLFQPLLAAPLRSSSQVA